eukprot:TRINITY_DN8234_c0_g1_i1.p1 TRINITY_DN8234_c0_g1~~TRINITY_DN8234_c0_g1_i1.p1  ORF type:complete len:200 (+),score=6.74 TRINITY_DN8234_c0_g1_i1:194-793(+)
MKSKVVCVEDAADHSSTRISRVSFAGIEPGGVYKIPTHNCQVNLCTKFPFIVAPRRNAGESEKLKGASCDLHKIPSNVWNVILDYFSIKDIFKFSTVSTYALLLVNTYPNAKARINRIFRTRMGLDYIRYHNKNEVDKRLRPICKLLTECKRYYRAFSTSFFKIWSILFFVMTTIVTPVLHSVSLSIDMPNIVLFTHYQ